VNVGIIRSVLGAWWGVQQGKDVMTGQGGQARCLG
jgi:hypothetical protein